MNIHEDMYRKQRLAKILKGMKRCAGFIRDKAPSQVIDSELALCVTNIVRMLGPKAFVSLGNLHLCETKRGEGLCYTEDCYLPATVENPYCARCNADMDQMSAMVDEMGLSDLDAEEAP